MTDELIEQVKTVLANASGGWLTDAEQDKIARAALASINLPAQLEAARKQGWNEAIEAAERELAMTCLANSEASSEWIDGFEHAGKRLRAIRALTKKNSDGNV